MTTTQTTQTQAKDYSTAEIQELLDLKVEKATQHSQEKPEPTIEVENPLKSPKLSKNPLSKLALVAIIMAVGSVFTGLFIQLWTSAQMSEEIETATNEEKSTKEGTEDTLAERNAQLTGKLALSQQEQQMKALKEKLDQERGLKEIPTAQRETPPPQPVAVKAPPKPVPQSQPVSKPTDRPQPVTYRPTPRPTAQRITQPPTPRPRPVTAPTPLKDPLQQWQELAQLGSYSASPSESNAQSPTNNTGIPVAQVPVTEVSLNPQSTRETLIAQTLNSTSTLTTDEILRAGQQVNVTLTTPIVWSEGAQQEEFFMVALSEPLINSQGQEMLPIGASILFSVQEISDNGLVIHQAIAIFHDGVEYPIPSNRLKLRTETNSPLIASKTNNNNMAGADTATFVLGALGKVGELTNRATSSTITNGVGGFSQSQSFGSTNYVGGLLEGGLEPLNRQWQQRNQQRYQELQQQPDLWHLEAGQNLNLFVNRSFRLGETDAQVPNSRRRDR